MKPLVAIELQCSEEEPGAFLLYPGYRELFREAGAELLEVPPALGADELRRLLDRADGLAIPGGDDIDPALYGQRAQAGTDAPIAVRDTAERVLLERAIERRMPYLGICRGMQMLNVVRGGTLHQRIPNTAGAWGDEQRHWQAAPYDAPCHTVELQPETPLAAIAGTERASVNSLHHQCVGELGRGLRAQAVAPDGVVESLYLPGMPFFMGVQWHPELMRDSALSQGLVRAFITACQSFHEDGRAQEAEPPRATR